MDKVKIMDIKNKTSGAFKRKHFIGMSKVNKIFDFLTPKVLRSIDERTLLQKCDQFQSKYSDVMDQIFRSSFSMFTISLFLN